MPGFDLLFGLMVGARVSIPAVYSSPLPGL
jgi:hypothetical protein